ncbi:MAG: hypothetical protein A2086_01045 [Spirochaetes bacterium GWD1_27_9]|nr:MAG: hypothetical protein A2Z98_15975 [Spirochaetes bacterium GWB1_27_13]OHD22663.1 MAG: hypothetical protein A2Y34_15685 [Spirochaetes bacterium GWC1_27_15]OHD33639.1 MAG: hypothetical protein A2086_01045 [Spirochaetes bacterium GWD1_27_9]
MAKDKILIADKSDMIKSFLKERLEQYGFEIILARDSFDAVIKMKNVVPDVVIMDYSLTQNLKVNFFEEKAQYKTIADVPVILFASKIDKNAIMQVAKYKVTKFFTKPLKIDVLLKSITEILKIDLNIDQTPCNIDIHLNDDILFIEVASGLNKDKIESIRYKIKEIKTLYKINMPKILIIMVDLKITEEESDKFYSFIESIARYGNPHLSAIKILTISDTIGEFLHGHEKFGNIEVTNDINYAIDKLCDLKIETLINRGWHQSEEDMIFWSNTDASLEEADYSTILLDKKPTIAIVDDDELILDLVKTILTTVNCDVVTYKNGVEFLTSLLTNTPDLLFLDLMMPKMNGFEVLENLKKANKSIPTIIFSALSQKETVKKALSFGVKSYIVKPVNPDILIKKASEILKSNF